MSQTPPPTGMAPRELDEVYYALAQAMTESGDDAQLVLSRFALLAVFAIDDAQRLKALIAQARLPDGGLDRLKNTDRDDALDPIPFFSHQTWSEHDAPGDMRLP